MTTSPTNNHPTRLALLDHALSMVRENGLRNLTVRGLCQRAGENTGSFVYHFGNRDQFAKELFENWYAPMFQQLQWQTTQKSDPLLRLQEMLRQLLAYFSANRDIIAQLLLDAAAGEQAVLQFIATLSPRHPQLFLRCLEEAQQAGQLCKAPPLQQFLFLVSALGLPILVQQMISGREILPSTLHSAFNDFAIEPQHIEQRLQWALKGLSSRELQA